MYIRLSKNKTKSNYRKILEEALVLAKREYDFAPGIPLNVSIYNQLIDIKKTVVEENCIYTEEAASKKYPLAIMAIRNYDGYEGWDYPDMLLDVSSGISCYPEMPEHSI